MTRSWATIFHAMMLIVCLFAPAQANDELHPGGRLFYPLWDVSTPNRLTFIIVTREALNDGQSIATTVVAGTSQTRFFVRGTGNCIPRGAGGSSSDVNRTDLGGTSAAPIFVDDVHFEYYGKSCGNANEVNHMSCADIDLFLLASPDNPSSSPRAAFAAVANERRGALDVHLVVNGGGGRSARKKENSLMGQAIISDLAEGWAATYPAAAAKATACPLCASVGGGTAVGYENYPMELMLPFALADSFPTHGGNLRNVLSLWSPGLFPGANITGSTFDVQFRWWDGRERFLENSISGHVILAPLGGDPVPGLDPPIDPAGFNVANFVCGHDAAGTKAENDGFPRSGSSAAACGVPSGADASHTSDNFESSGDLNQAGHDIQSSTPIGWWRFTLTRDGRAPNGVSSAAGASVLAHSGRGLVGVVLSSTASADARGVSDAVRLWHKGGCGLAQSNQTFGPPHLRDGGVGSNPSSSFSPGDLLSLFNVFDVAEEAKICAGEFTGM